MSKGRNIEKYSFVMRIMHWLHGSLIVSMLAFGLLLAHTSVFGAEVGPLVMLHKSFGMIVLLFFIVRVSIRVFSYIPPPPLEIPSWQAKVAKSVYFFLYVGMMVIPLSGYIMSSLSRRSINMFGLFEFPLLAVEKNGPLAGIFYNTHAITSYCLIGLFTLHVSGWLKHLIFEKINLAKRII